MPIFKRDMKEFLIDVGCLSVIDPLFATRKGGELILMWNEAEASANYFCDYNFLNDDALNKARFLTLVDYLTYTPYGSSGYAAFEEMLKKVHPEMSVADYRLKWFKELLGDNCSRLSDKQYQYVKDYFDCYNKKTIKLNQLAEVISLLCRYHHECEANFRRGDFVNISVISDRTDLFSRQIAKMRDADANGSADCDQLLSEVPAYGELSEQEKEYIHTFCGL